MTQKNKLVRDLIPKIIQYQGRKAAIKTLDESEYKLELDKKLQEEVQEYIQDQTIEELADILEVVYAIAKIKQVSVEALEKIRLEKLEKRGGFEKRIFLKEIMD